MCGIIGYVGKRNAADIILSGLQRLEYRGYDSAGLALYSSKGKTLVRARVKGKISELYNCVEEQISDHSGLDYSAGIGHTRWATHGAPTEENAHPHFSRNSDFAIVHNGIIENYLVLKENLIQKGYSFSSETDSEVLAHLIEACYEGDFHRAVVAALENVEGTYGIAVISRHHPGVLVAARKGSPIAIGVGNKETVVASDVSAIISHTNQVVFLDDEDVATVTADTLEISSLKNMPVSRDVTRVDCSLGRIEKGGFDHFMHKEIHEQPEALSNAIRGRLIEKDGTTKLSGIRMTSADLVRINRVAIAACGTSYYAGMVGKYYFEDLAGVPSDIEQAAEFRYRNPIMERDTCLLAISQSGETADTIEAVREAVRKGATVLGICNVVGSTIARESGRGVYIHAGPEIGVASTKAFTCQIVVLAMLSIAFGRARRMSSAMGNDLVREIKRVPSLVEAVLEQEQEIQRVAEKYAKAEHMFFLGRGYMYPAALEGALKLKEISYIHAEGYHAAELKHGPISLLDENVPVVVAVPDIHGKSKTMSNMQECLARKSPVIAMATSEDQEINSCCTDIIRLPRCSNFLSPIPVVVAEQLLAYHVAKCRGCSIDQPRNLAKSVTVE